MKRLSLILALCALCGCAHKAPGFPHPFRSLIGSSGVSDTIETEPVPSKIIVRKWIIRGLLVVAAIAFMAVPTCIFAAIYWHWGAGVPLAAICGLTSIISTGSAYFFDSIIWVLGAGMIAAVIFAVYLAFNSGKLKRVIYEIVDSAEDMRHNDWNAETKVAVFKKQSEHARNAVKKAKAVNVKKKRRHAIKKAKITQ